jgi:hypothetical protein
VSTLHVAAALGALLLAFEAYLLVRWVTGPDFQRVPIGPSDMPGWMRAGVLINQPVMVAGAAWCFWRFLIAPWRRDRTVGLFGLLCPALLLASVYDPLGSYFHGWYGYNSAFVNFGSPLPGGVPGWQGFAEPGRMIAWPIIFIPCIYVIFFLFCTWAGGRLIGLLERRVTRSVPVILALTFLAIAALDVLVEGTIMMRLGWYAETGDSLAAGHYFQLPWRNVIFASLLWTIFAAFGHYRDDRGFTLVERGAERLPSASARTLGLRLLAVLAATQVILIGAYQVPMALHERSHHGHWPASISGRSYFNDGQCGYGTPRRCP